MNCPYCNNNEAKYELNYNYFVCNKCSLFYEFKDNVIIYWSCHYKLSSAILISYKRTASATKLIEGDIYHIYINDYFEFPNSLNDFNKLFENLMKLSLYK